MGISPPDKYGYIRIDGVRHRTSACHPKNCGCGKCREMRNLNSQDREYDYIGVAGSRTRTKGRWRNIKDLEESMEKGFTPPEDQ